MDATREAELGPLRGESEREQTESLSQLFHRCLDLYSELYLALGKEKCRPVELNHVSIEKAGDEYGRLRLWGIQTRATLPAHARGSLDDTLRHDQTLRANVADMFRLLADQLALALSVVEKATDGSTEPDMDSDGSFVSDSDDSESSSDYAVDGNTGVGAVRDRAPRSKGKVPKISVLMSHVYEQVGLLYHLSLLLRRPAVVGRYLKSSIKDKTLSPFAQYDYNHVQEKFRYWRRMAELDLAERDDPADHEVSSEQSTAASLVTPGLGDKSDSTISENDIDLRRSMESSEKSFTLVCRLASANTRRREQLRYWAGHPPVNTPQPGFSTSISSARKGMAPERPQPVLTSEQRNQAGTAQDSDPAEAKSLGQSESRSLFSTPTAATFSTAAVSGIDGTQTLAGPPRTIYAETVVATGQRSTRVPDPPYVAPGATQFECPLCHTSLQVVVMRDRNAWKRHVFRDLRPYVCTVDNCLSGDKLYATRHEWIYHEMQVHLRQWTCQRCDETFETKDLMASHLRTSHPESWTSQQISVLLDMSERPLDETRIVACPICPNELYLNKLLTHLAEHMEEISLFVLPSVSEEGDDDGSQVMRVSLNGDKPNSDPAMSDIASLSFSAPDVTERPPEYQQTLQGLADSTPPDSFTKTAAWDLDADERHINPLTLSEHTSGVTGVSFAPNSRLLASSSHDYTVRLWDPITGALLHTLTDHTSAATSVAFSPDGRLLASGSWDNAIRLWDPTTGALLHTLDGHTRPVDAVAFSPDGSLLASGAMDKTVRLWDPTTGALLHTLSGHTSGVSSVAFSPDGRILASGGEDKTIRLWNPTTNALIHTLEGHTDQVHAVAFSPDGRILASGAWDKTVRLWDTKTGALLHPLIATGNWVRTVAFSPNGKILASGLGWVEGMNFVCLWEPTTGALLYTIESDTSGVASVSFSPDGRLLASSSEDTIQLWELSALGFASL